MGQTLEKEGGISRSSGALAAFDRRVGGSLLDHNLIIEDQLKEAKELQSRQGQPLVDVLVGLGMITAKEALETVSGVLDMPAIDLATTRTDTAVIGLLPPDKAFEHLAVPLFAVGGTCTLALAEPYDLERLNALQFILEREILPVFALRSDIELFLDQFHGGAPSAPAAQEAAAELLEFDPQTEDEPPAAGDELSLEALESDRPLVRLANLILTSAIADHTTDIHLEPGEGGMQVRFRIDGVLQIRPFDVPRDMVAALTSRIKILSKLDISERRLPQDGKMRIRFQGRRIDVRVSTFPSIHGEKVVMRLLDKERMDFRLDRLGFSPALVSSFERVLGHRDGIVLVTGPTGSGKSSTLYAGLRSLHSPEINIIALEDPVEYELEGITQTQVHPAIGFTFAVGLRSVLRQDPDIILVGEIRDLETAQIAFQSAQTGHLVLASLHTNDAPSAISRLVDIGVPPYLLASTLRGIVAQRLLRKVCPSCVETVEPTSAERQLVGRWLNNSLEFRDGSGCEECDGKGYRGRSAIAELMPIDRELGTHITANASAAVLAKEAESLGYRGLWYDGLDRVAEGKTTLRELLRVVPCPSERESAAEQAPSSGLGASPAVFEARASA